MRDCSSLVPAGGASERAPAVVWCALSRALQAGHLELARQIIQRQHLASGFEPGICQILGSALFYCCSRGFLELANLLLETGAPVGCRHKSRATPLHAAVDNGHLHVVRLLISRGADLNVQNSRGDTPLHSAAYRGFLDISCCLLGAGADCDLLNAHSMRAEDEAYCQGHRDLAACLKLHRCGRDPQMTDSHIDTFSSMIQLEFPSDVTLTESHSLSQPLKVTLTESVGNQIPTEPHVNGQFSASHTTKHSSKSSIQSVSRETRTQRISAATEQGRALSHPTPVEMFEDECNSWNPIDWTLVDLSPVSLNSSSASPSPCQRPSKILNVYETDTIGHQAGCIHPSSSNTLSVASSKVPVSMKLHTSTSQPSSTSAPPSTSVSNVIDLQSANYPISKGRLKKSDSSRISPSNTDVTIVSCTSDVEVDTLKDSPVSMYSNVKPKTFDKENIRIYTREPDKHQVVSQNHKLQTLQLPTDSVLILKNERSQNPQTAQMKIEHPPRSSLNSGQYSSEFSDIFDSALFSLKSLTSGKVYTPGNNSTVTGCSTQQSRCHSDDGILSGTCLSKAHLKPNEGSHGLYNNKPTRALQGDVKQSVLPKLSAEKIINSQFCPDLLIDSESLNDSQIRDCSNSSFSWEHGDEIFSKLTWK